MHIFIPTNVDSFEEKICKFCHFLYFRSTGVGALRASTLGNATLFYFTISKSHFITYTITF